MKKNKTTALITLFFVFTALMTTVKTVMALVNSGDDLYAVQITVSQSDVNEGASITKKVTNNTTQDLFNTVNKENIQTEFGAQYNASKVVINADLNYRGVKLTIDYAENSTELQLTIPALGIQKTFDSGVSRNASNNQLIAYFKKKDNDNVINRLNKLLVEKSPTDPLAGNPSSLLGSTVDNVFNAGAGIKTTDVSNSSSSDGDTQVEGRSSLFATGFQLGQFRQGGKDVVSYTLPIDYNFEVGDHDRLLIGIPISYLKVNDAESYKIGLNLALRKAINQKLTLTTAIGYGLLGSKDLVSAGQLGSLSLSTLYQFDKSTIGGNNWSLSMANMVGHYQTFPIEIRGVNIDPDISNTVVKNGLIINAKTKMFGSRNDMQIYVTDTRFFGDALYTQKYNEVGMYFAPEDKSGLKQSLGINIGYLFGAKDISGFKLSLRYSF